MSALDAVPGSLETQHYHRLETFLRRQVLRRASKPSRNLKHGTNVLRRSKHQDANNLWIRRCENVGRTVSKHNLFHDSILGFPLTSSAMTKINFDKCLRTPMQRILGTATSHKKQHEPTFPNDQATKMRPGSKKIMGTTFRASG